MGYLNFIEDIYIQTDEKCKIAVQQNGCALQYVIDQTDEICKLAFRNICFASKYVKIKPMKYVNYPFYKCLMYQDM
jgi:hypothetical protein